MVQRTQWGPTVTPPGTKALLIATLAGSFAAQLLPPRAVELLAVPALARPWTYVLAGAVVGSPLGLVISLYMIWAFGSQVETRLGQKRYLWLYVVTSSLGFLAAGLWGLALAGPAGGYALYGVGAYVGLAALFAAYGHIHRQSTILLFALFPVNAWKLVQFALFMDLTWLVYSRGQALSALATLVAALLSLGYLMHYLDGVLAWITTPAASWRAWRQGSKRARFTVLQGGKKDPWRRDEDAEEDGKPPTIH